ncbi:hypothetical protein VTJ83DRAFT_6233 [Remersonia thermophila]|uniref:Beta-lactamase-related domain-containing protein n=1 Tax=Remersonia thermophila TaxID=72144 RepID=A0ABR4D438_9PEZI
MVSIRLLALGALALGASALPADKRSSSASSARSAEVVDEAFGSAVREKRVPGIAALALNRDGTVLYKNAWGTVNIDDASSAPITSSTKMRIASMTKSVVSVAALQLVEQEKLSLDDLVEDYLPKWKNASVLEGFTDDGEPILRAPKTKATILHLFTHTAGEAYWFINTNINRYQQWAARQNTTVSPAPLAADPGTGWYYGTSIDTLGNVIEAITGLRLDDYIEHNIFRPLGIQNSGLVTPDIWTHQRLDNGTIVAVPPAPVDPTSTPGGGGYLISTLDNYSNYLLALVNWGTHPRSGVTILKSSTVKKYVFADLVPLAVPKPPSCEPPPARPNGEGDVGIWNSNNLTLSLASEFLPGVPKGWSASFLINNEAIPGRRSEGSGAWAGIHNLYYWADVKAGKLGIVFTNLAPFLDPTVLGLYDTLEEFAYSA